ncbi:MAG: lysoplasmalogenase [Saprospiraceae bacterium]|nr:lysoplasmalogenase [Saprospiraceae bacterium]
MLIKKYFPVVYVIIVLLDLVLMHLLPEGRWFSKPLIMISLIYLYAQVKDGAIDRMFFSAMIFALLGDVFLLVNKSNFFILGILAFMVMQVRYGQYFLRQRKLFGSYKYILSAIVIAICLWFNITFSDRFGELRIPVMVYSGAISFMAITAIAQEKSRLILYGSLIFVLSDLLLAYNKFVNPMMKLDIWVMITYSLAQFLIVNGSLKNGEKDF